MKNIVLSLILTIVISFTLKAQTTRFFEFTTNCGHGNWQDTSFIASTSNQVIIDSVLANLARPLTQRNFIAGPIDYGNGGHNHNGNHWFLWHFIPNQWDLAEVAIEVCDGCPYSDVDADTAYWVGNIGAFCPWSGRPVREVPDPISGNKDPIPDNELMRFPNPVTEYITISLESWNPPSRWTPTEIEIYDVMGVKIRTTPSASQPPLHEGNFKIDVSHLAHGVYFLKIGNRVQKFVKL